MRTNRPRGPFYTVFVLNRAARTPLVRFPGDFHRSIARFSGPEQFPSDQGASDRVKRMKSPGVPADGTLETDTIVVFSGGIRQQIQFGRYDRLRRVFHTPPLVFGYRRKRVLKIKSDS